MPPAETNPMEGPDARSFAESERLLWEWAQAGLSEQQIEARIEEKRRLGPPRPTRCPEPENVSAPASLQNALWLIGKERPG